MAVIHEIPTSSLTEGSNGSPSRDHRTSRIEEAHMTFLGRWWIPFHTPTTVICFMWIMTLSKSPGSAASADRWTYTAQHKVTSI